MKLKDGKKALASMGIWGGIALIGLGLFEIKTGNWNDGVVSIAEGIGIIGIRRAQK